MKKRPMVAIVEEKKELIRIDGNSKKVFEFGSKKAVLDKDGAWRLEGTVKHNRLRCADYRVGFSLVGVMRNALLQNGLRILFMEWKRGIVIMRNAPILPVERLKVLESIMMSIIVLNYWLSVLEIANSPTFFRSECLS